MTSHSACGRVAAELRVWYCSLSWALVLFGASTAASYYVDALWFESLGFASVFWTRLSLQAATFGAFAFLTFLVVYGVFRALKPDRLDALIGATVLVNRRPVALPVDTLPQADRDRPLRDDRRRNRRQHDGALDDLGPVLGRAASAPQCSTPFSGDRSTFTCLRCRPGSSSPAGC